MESNRVGVTEDGKLVTKAIVKYLRYSAEVSISAVASDVLSRGAYAIERGDWNEFMPFSKEIVESKPTRWIFHYSAKYYTGPGEFRMMDGLVYSPEPPSTDGFYESVVCIIASMLSPPQRPSDIMITSLSLLEVVS